MPIRGFFSDNYIHLNAPPGAPPHQAHTAVPYVLAVVHLRVFNRRVLVPFLLDTGADATTLHPQDSLRIVSDVEIKALGSASPFGGAGQGKDHYPTDAVVIFAHEDNHLEAIPLTVYIAEPAAHNQYLPSLLGRDALAHFPLSYDQAGRSFTLG